MKKLWSFLGTNFDTVIAIIISIGAAFYGVFSGNQLPLLAGIATSLSILAVSLIRDRHNREALNSQVAKLEDAIIELSSEKIISSKFFYPRSSSTDLPVRLRKVRYTLDLLGPSLSSISVTHQSILRELKNNGVQIRLLVSNPDNIALQEFLSMRYLEAETATIHANQVKGSLISLSQIVGTGLSGGSIKIRITNHVPTFSYIGSDVGKPEGEIQIEFYLTKTGLDRDPMFLLKQTRDAHWFNEFSNQFSLLWKDSTDIEPRKYVE